jgi:Tfp pilus assembly protein PilN
VVLDGDGVLSIAVHVGGSVRFARTLHLDQGVDQELSAVLEAELSAIDMHRAGSHAEIPGDRTDPVGEAVTATLDHVRTTDPEAAARVVHVLGTPEVADTLARAIDARTGLPTHIRDVGLVDQDPLLGADLLAAGHAIRVAGPSHGPSWPRLGQVGRASSSRDLRHQVAIITAGAALLAVAGLVLVGPDPSRAREEADSLQRDVDAMTERLAALDLEDEQASELAQLQRLVDEVDATAVDWPGILAAVEAGRPEGSTLLSVEATAGDAEAEEPGGLRLTVQAADTSAVQPWLEMLESIEGLSEPWLEVASASDASQVGGPSTFTIRAEVGATTPAAEG